MTELERLDKIINFNSKLLQLKIEAILSTFDEEQTIKYKSHLTFLAQDALNLSQETSSEEHVQELKTLLGL